MAAPPRPQSAAWRREAIVGSGREQAPRGPARRPDPIGARLAAELQAGSPGQRVALALLLGAGAVGGLYGGYALTRATSNWLTWSVALLVLDPIGVTSLLAALVILFPRSGLANLLALVLPQGKLALLLVGLAFLGAIVWAVIGVALVALNLA
jgi:hypothetical protein